MNSSGFGGFAALAFILPAIGVAISLTVFYWVIRLAVREESSPPGSTAHAGRHVDRPGPGPAGLNQSPRAIRDDRQPATGNRPSHCPSDGATDSL